MQPQQARRAVNRAARTVQPSRACDANLLLCYAPSRPFAYFLLRENLLLHFIEGTSDGTRQLSALFFNALSLHTAPDARLVCCPRCRPRCLRSPQNGEILP